MARRRRQKKARQLSLPEPKTWGGRRPGAGRKRKRGRRRVRHTRRPRLASRFPVLVTSRLAPGLPSLRKHRLSRLIRRSFVRAHKARFRVCHFSVQGNHLHLICEAAGAEALARGMQGFLSGVARRINNALERKGEVFEDRYHMAILRTPRQVKHALTHVLQNIRRHSARHRGMRNWIDPFSSARYFDGWSSPLPPGTGPPEDASDWPVALPRTWLLSVGWRRHGLLGIDEAPAAAPG